MVELLLPEGVRRAPRLHVDVDHLPVAHADPDRPERLPLAHACVPPRHVRRPPVEVLAVPDASDSCVVSAASIATDDPQRPALGGPSALENIEETVIDHVEAVAARARELCPGEVLTKVTHAATVSLLERVYEGHTQRGEEGHSTRR